MASTACFLHHHHSLSTPARSSSQPHVPTTLKPNHLIICKAQKQAVQEEDGGAALSRRSALSMLLGSANIFGKPKTNTDFLPYNGEGFKIQIPSKWNPSKEMEYPGQVLRYEDNLDSNSVTVTVTPTDKKSITDYGSPKDFLSKVFFIFFIIISRIMAHTLLLGSAAIGSKVSPTDAAYGESANIFGKPKTNTDFLPYNGEGFKIQIPSKWNPSKKVEYPGQVLWFENSSGSNSNSTSTNTSTSTSTSTATVTVNANNSNVTVTVSPIVNKSTVDKFFGKIESEGGFDPNEVATTNTGFLPYNGEGFKIIPSKWNPSKKVEYPGQVLWFENNDGNNSTSTSTSTSTATATVTANANNSSVTVTVTPTINKSTVNKFFGKTESEGGFNPNAVATTNKLESSVPVIGGKPYYSLPVLTRTADGGEGGKHQLITATVSDYICKAQAGVKRWLKGARRFVEGTAGSYSVA